MRVCCGGCTLHMWCIEVFGGELVRGCCTIDRACDELECVLGVVGVVGEQLECIWVVVSVDVDRVGRVCRSLSENGCPRGVDGHASYLDCLPSFTLTRRTSDTLSVQRTIILYLHT